MPSRKTRSAFYCSLVYWSIILLAIVMLAKCGPKPAYAYTVMEAKGYNLDDDRFTIYHKQVAEFPKWNPSLMLGNPEKVMWVFGSFCVKANYLRRFVVLAGYNQGTFNGKFMNIKVHDEHVPHCVSAKDM